ncbi:lipolytic enzyme, G-D-S-L [Asticcacaulis biprosthecium C19]|uniref:Lipolytic enzyme, G-D-S-L n=1 Tax=Asticcacaulis biprosthecium C19 TaxID=715226 RepID=F4QNA7_9CAUL|nr:SGNH/GDSL hydrolase family protein [Asticcacaulis biprosthecium]EGF90815.1 lipolytic enzyme, G-D-S-L [Asticcacaulis biprosthecium C19]
MLIAALMSLAMLSPVQQSIPQPTEPAVLLPMKVVGKVLPHAQGYSHQWPGVYFETQAKGPVISLAFQDDNSNFNVVVDGKPLLIVKKPGATQVNISLPEGSHTVRVEKRSETQYATGQFLGFVGWPGTPAAALTRQIEFVGDSLTVGYGNTSPYSDCTPEDIFETTDAQQGFGPIIAKHFTADYQINAFSGLGMVRNYGGFEHPKYRMPMLYPRALFDDPTPAPRDGWMPQVMVIGIGGNDFSTPVAAGEPWKDEAALQADYEKTYVRFVKNLRKTNPDAFLILTSPDERNGYTQGTTAVYEALKADGETKIARLTIPPTVSDGCNGHPNTRDDANIAKMFIAWLEAHPEVWQGK